MHDSLQLLDLEAERTIMDDDNFEEGYSSNPDSGTDEEMESLFDIRRKCTATKSPLATKRICHNPKGLSSKNFYSILNTVSDITSASIVVRVRVKHLLLQ